MLTQKGIRLEKTVESIRLLQKVKDLQGLLGLLL